VKNAKGLQRLDQILSRYGYCSRKDARAWIRAGRVLIEGVAPRSADEKVAPEAVRIDGRAIDSPDGLLVLLHKPAGYVCSHNEREGATVYELLPAQWLQRNPPVTTIGRLDKDTTGLLLITDIGPLVQQWTSPRHKVTRTYEVTLDRDLDPRLIELFASGTLQLEDEPHPCKPARLEIVGPRQARLEIIEGRFHQVKRMFASQGWRVTALHRSRFGSYELGALQPGEWQHLPWPDP
jgi:16S rRNA pseudouridine516 synthase